MVLKLEVGSLKSEVEIKFKIILEFKFEKLIIWQKGIDYGFTITLWQK
jgi:hypothetical protein